MQVHIVFLTEGGLFLALRADLGDTRTSVVESERLSVIANRTNDCGQ